MEKIKLKNNDSLEELLNIPSIKILEFDPHVPDSDGKTIAFLPTKLILYPNYLEYFTNYVIENEFIFEKDKEEFSLEEETELKKLKCEDQSILDKNDCTFSRVTENILNPPEEGGTTLLYKILIDTPSTAVGFILKSKKEQISIYNQLINWKYGK